jgi:hypothetical protein
VGRAEELQAIVAGLRSPELGAFVIAGPAGVGKTRLASAAGTAVSGEGRTVLEVAATEAAAAVPFGAFSWLLPAVDRSPAGLLGFMQDAVTAIAGHGDGEAPVVLVVDDAHLLDHGSAALVHQLVVARACAVVATVRTPDVPPDPIVSLWKDGLATPDRPAGVDP